MEALTQPGERELLGADEAALMQNLRNATLPAALSSSDEDAQTAPQYQQVINPSLLNSGFDGDAATGWTLDGRLTVANHAATLTETTAAPAHLSQAFLVNPGDRLLSFTLSERDLRANATGPGDAFEVALLNANTGASVAGAVALPRSDALLNLQADGTERLAPGVRKSSNPDGTATYYVDLPAALADTPVALAFDLLGFGAAASHVTVRDIHLGSGDPKAFDDAATLDEDTPATGHILANDFLGDAGTVQAQLVDGPAHGQLTLDDDGTFAYQPAADYSGPDAFTYRFVDGTGKTSNTARVDLAIRPVNDSPVLPAPSVATVTAGKTHSFDPLAGAHDVDSSTLTFQWLSGPQHGTLTANPDGTQTYLADATYAGSDTITWQVSDGSLASAPVALDITVNPANTAPLAQDGALTLAEDGSLLIDPASFGTDAESDPLTAAITAQPQHGTLQVQADGRWLYTPAGNYHGADSLRFTLSDGRLTSNEASLALTVPRSTTPPSPPI